MSTKKPLREGLKQMLQEDHLNETEIAQMQISQQAATERVPESYLSFKRLARSSNLAVASSLLITLLAVGSFTLWKASDEIPQRIAKEALTNHLKVKNLDLETSSMTDLRNYFDRLNFSPFYSKFLNQSNLHLLGARYCTLQGVIALQLRFLTPEGEMVTYYQALYDKEHFGKLPDVKEGKQPHEVTTNGFAMRIWKEDGVVVVLAQAGQ